MKILTVMAHPDDEIIWGWPINQDKSIERHVLITCNTRTSNHLQYKGRGFKALEEIAFNENLIIHDSPNLDSGFYRLNHRNVPFTSNDAIKKIKDSIPKDFDYYLTHNPHGEYGHGDHILLFRIVAELFKEKTMFCNANYRANHYNDNPYYIKKQTISKHKQNTKFIKRTVDIYKKHGAWSWHEDKIPNTLTLERLNGRG